MARVIDITDRITFEENPVVTVKGVEIELNADALDFLTVVGMMKDGDGTDNLPEVCRKLCATSEDYDKLYSLRLKTKGLMQFVTEAIKTIMGADAAEGEAPTPAMT